MNKNRKKIHFFSSRAFSSEKSTQLSWLRCDVMWHKVRRFNGCCSLCFDFTFVGTAMADKKLVYKYCFVPGCKSTTTACPEKVFFSVPRNEKENRRWMLASRRDLKLSPVAPKSHLHCCQDHFDIENDMVNYLKFRMYQDQGFHTLAKLKPGVVPHKFDCQVVRNLTLPKPRFSVVEKLHRQQLLRDALSPHPSPEVEPVSEVASTEDHPTEPASPPPSVEMDGPFHKGTQTPKHLGRPSVRSIRCQTDKAKPEKRSLTIDADTQMTPAKKPRSLESHSPEPISSSTDSSGETIISVGGSSYVVTSTESSSGTSLPDTPHKPLKKIMREASLKIIENNPKFYLGVIPESYKFLEKIASLCKLPMKNVLLTLKKLRLNPPFTCLGDDFGISQSHASRIFSSTIPILAAEMNCLIYFPEKKYLAQNMPIPFRRRYSKVTSIIDCFEIKIEKPSDPYNQSLTWSEYKKGNTLKFLVSCTPHGFINYVSGGYCGRTTDTNLAKHCGLASSLNPGDYIMADRGFKGLEPFLRERGIHLVRPPSVSSGEQLSAELVRESKRIASLRIHIERVIGRLRVFHFVSPDTHIDCKLIPLLNSAVIVICALCNLQGPLLL